MKEAEAKAKAEAEAEEEEMQRKQMREDQWLTRILSRCLFGKRPLVW